MSLLWVLVLVLPFSTSVQPNPLTCIRNGNEYNISNRACTCFKATDLNNRNFGYHWCPTGTAFDVETCVCHFPSRFKCNGGRLLQKEAPFCRRYPDVEIVVAVDDSSFIVKFDTDVKKFMRTLTQGLDVQPMKIHVGILQFSKDATVVLYPTGNKEEVMATIDDLVYRGEPVTNLDMALKVAREQMFSEVDEKDTTTVGPRKVLAVITQGILPPGNTVKEETRLTHDAGIEIFSVGASAPNYETLKMIASLPAHEYIVRPSAFRLIALLTNDGDEPKDESQCVCS